MGHGCWEWHCALSALNAIDKSQMQLLVFLMAASAAFHYPIHHPNGRPLLHSCEKETQSSFETATHVKERILSIWKIDLQSMAICISLACVIIRLLTLTVNTVAARQAVPSQQHMLMGCRFSADVSNCTEKPAAGWPVAVALSAKQGKALQSALAAGPIDVTLAVPNIPAQKEIGLAAFSGVQLVDY